MASLLIIVVQVPAILAIYVRSSSAYTENDNNVTFPQEYRCLAPLIEIHWYPAIEEIALKTLTKTLMPAYICTYVAIISHAH